VHSLYHHALAIIRESEGAATAAHCSLRAIPSATTGMLDGVQPQSDATCLLLGGDAGHLTQHSFPGLLPALTAAQLRVDFITKGPALSAAKLLGKQLVVIFADGYTQEPSGYDTTDERGDQVRVSRFGPSWMTEQQAQDLEDFVLAGGCFLAIHNSMWGYPIRPRPRDAPRDPNEMLREMQAVQAVLAPSAEAMSTERADRDLLAVEEDMGPYRRLCGGVGGYHPAFERIEVLVTDSDHPITAGVEDFVTHDEQHYVFFDAHRGAKMILKNRGSDGRESCAGYVFQHGAGRVCYLAPGHVPLSSQPSMVMPDDEPDALAHPQVQLLLHNAVRWLVAESAAESARL
jgi:hypothetical protein